jgi:hypothetical protein
MEGFTSRSIQPHKYSSSDFTRTVVFFRQLTENYFGHDFFRYLTLLFVSLRWQNNIATATTASSPKSSSSIFIIRLLQHFISWTTMKRGALAKNKNLASSDCLSALVIAIVDCLPKRHAHLSQCYQLSIYCSLIKWIFQFLVLVFLMSINKTIDELLKYDDRGKIRKNEWIWGVSANEKRWTIPLHKRCVLHVVLWVFRDARKSEVFLKVLAANERTRHEKEHA